jgi:hypothetical protein
MRKGKSCAKQFSHFFSSMFISKYMAVPVKTMKVHFAFENKNTNLQMKLFELPLERGPDSGETEVSPLATPFPKFKPIPADGLRVKKGGLKPFMMVIENNSTETKYFFATTHSIMPETASIGFRLGCLCNNHITKFLQQVDGLELVKSH